MHVRVLSTMTMKWYYWRDMGVVEVTLMCFLSHSSPRQARAVTFAHSSFQKVNLNLSQEGIITWALSQCPREEFMSWHKHLNAFSILGAPWMEGVILVITASQCFALQLGTGSELVSPWPLPASCTTRGPFLPLTPQFFMQILLCPGQTKGLIPAVLPQTLQRGGSIYTAPSETGFKLWAWVLHK